MAKGRGGEDMRILVACDGSESSLSAVRYLGEVPFINPEITLMHVVAPVSFDAGAGF